MEIIGLMNRKTYNILLTKDNFQLSRKPFNQFIILNGVLLPNIRFYKIHLLDKSLFMKTIFSVSVFLILITVSQTYAQIENSNTMSANINGKEITGQPRQLKIGHYGYFTTNLSKPDRMLRVWVADFFGRSISESGKYLIVNADKPDTKDNIKKAQDLGIYKGLAAIRYVEETKSPRMEFQVGDSGNNGEVMEVTINNDGTLTMQIEKCTLQGTYWKEKATATVFGGLDRLKSKLEDKVVTEATGWDQNMDPEGRGYKRQDKKDQISIANVRLKLKK
jgi:hypothetical protein